MLMIADMTEGRNLDPSLTLPSRLARTERGHAQVRVDIDWSGK